MGEWGNGLIGEWVNRGNRVMGFMVWDVCGGIVSIMQGSKKS
jgi:hypothetical protein